MVSASRAESTAGPACEGETRLALPRVALARALLSAARPTVATASTTTEAPTVHTWACPRCGAAMILGPILSALQLTTITLGFDTS
jgi:hypothetical protein